MANELEDESYVIQIRAKLNQQRVKLWELPYYNVTTEECFVPEMEVIYELCEFFFYNKFVLVEIGNGISRAATNICQGLPECYPKTTTKCIGKPEK